MVTFSKRAKQVAWTLNLGFLTFGPYGVSLVSLPFDHSYPRINTKFRKQTLRETLKT